MQDKIGLLWWLWCCVRAGGEGQLFFPLPLSPLSPSCLAGFNTSSQDGPCRPSSPPRHHNVANLGPHASIVPSSEKKEREREAERAKTHPVCRASKPHDTTRSPALYLCPFDPMLHHHHYFHRHHHHHAEQPRSRRLMAPTPPRATPTPTPPPTTPPHRRPPPHHGTQVDDNLSQLDDGSGWFTICGFGSLLSERSARTTLPDLRNFRKARLVGSSSSEGEGGQRQPACRFRYRRVFAHTADVFFERGIARPETREVASLSIERVEVEGDEQEDNGGLVVTAFDTPYTPSNVAAFVAREHEFKLVAVHLSDGSVAVACERWTDDEYVARRFGGDREAFWRRWGVIARDGFGNGTVWHDPSVLPCRLYFRHCVLAARNLGEEDAFLDSTWLADRRTTAREWLERLERESGGGGGGFLRDGGGVGGSVGGGLAYDRALLERYGG